MGYSRSVDTDVPSVADLFRGQTARAVHLHVRYVYYTSYWICREHSEQAHDVGAPSQSVIQHRENTQFSDPYMYAELITCASYWF
jgi:hypothetical protein